MPSRSLAVTVILASWLLAGHALLHAGTNSRQASSLIQRFLDDPDPLVSYRGTRRLEASTRGGRMQARMTARTTLDPAQGFQYSIVDEDGSSIIRRKVLRAALEEERSLREHEGLNRTDLTDDNYDFATDSAAEAGLVRIAIHPKRHDTMLLEGSILLTEERADLVQIEGLMIRRPSIWTRRVEVVRRYARIQGHRVPISTYSTADVVLVGTSTFSMTYEYETINGDPISFGEPPATGLGPP